MIIIDHFAKKSAKNKSLNLIRDKNDFISITHNHQSKVDKIGASNDKEIN
jgi:hypothetical protein